VWKVLAYGQKKHFQSITYTRQEGRVEPQNKYSVYYLETNTVFYKVAWKGYSDEEATWEPTENLGKTLQK